MSDKEVTDHYSSGDLFQAIIDALRTVGKDPDNLRPEDLDPVEHFHGRGVNASAEMAATLSLSPSDEVLDIGSGVGGPARFIARTYGCHVVGIDLTADFCDTARRLTEAVGMTDQVRFEQASATALPFPDGSFDAVYSQNVSMNIADKAAFFSEPFRVLRSGGLFALSEVALGDGGPVIYPTPWSADGVHSHLLTEEETVDGLQSAGFDVISVTDKAEASRAYLKSQRQKAAKEGAPKLGPFILMGTDYREKGRNAARNQEEGRVRAIEILCRRSA